MRVWLNIDRAEVANIMDSQEFDAHRCLIWFTGLFRMGDYKEQRVFFIFEGNIHPTSII